MSTIGVEKPPLRVDVQSTMPDPLPSKPPQAVAANLQPRLDSARIAVTCEVRKSGTKVFIATIDGVQGVALTEEEARCRLERVWAMQQRFEEGWRERHSARAAAEARRGISAARKFAAMIFGSRTIDLTGCRNR